MSKAKDLVYFSRGLARFTARKRFIGYFILQ